MESITPQKTTSHKQAIVVIHGMGEQRPMETLRQFVDTVWNDDRKLNQNDAKDKTWVTPDIGVGNTELMRIATDFHECRLQKNDDENAEARTDFFEFYWADIFADSRLSMLTPWVRALFLRLPGNVPYSVFSIWVGMWTVLFLMITGFGQAIYAVFNLTDTKIYSASNFTLFAGRWLIDFIAAPDVYSTIFALIAIYALLKITISIWPALSDRLDSPNLVTTLRQIFIVIVIAMFVLASAKYLSQLADENRGINRGLLQILPLNILLSFVILFVLNSFIVPYFGDVARYLHTSPNTVGKREEIRQRGLALLRRLHEGDKYARIVIVSHSLGTVIAYDLIRILWAEYGPVSSNTPLNEEQIIQFQNVAEVADKAGIGNIWSKAQILEYRAAQKNAFYALQTNNNAHTNTDKNSVKQWKISDLVTCGSPLTHAEFLVAKSEDQLDRLKAERTLPICPPAFESGKNKYAGGENSQTYLYCTGNIDNEQVFTHHATPFAVVRWTNMYDWRILGFLGDFVSGPLRYLFGTGIADYHIRMYHGAIDPLLRYVTHTLYWRNKNVVSHPAGEMKKNRIDEIPYHIALLRSAVDMRFAHDQMSKFEPGAAISFPLAKISRWIVSAMLGLAILAIFYLVWSYLWIWTSTFMNF